MIIGKRRLKQFKLFLVSPRLEQLVSFCYLIIVPIILMYDQVSLSNGTLDLNQIRAYFQFDQFEQCNTTNKSLNYLENTFFPKYFSKGFRSNHIPVSKLVIAQQRNDEYICNSTFINCTYKNQDKILKQLAKPENNSMCIDLDCYEFDKRLNIFGEGNVDTYVRGHYIDYQQFIYYADININESISDTFYKLKNNNWIDNYTECIAIFGSIFDLKTQLQIQITLLIEKPQQTESLYSKEIFFQLPFYDMQDQVHMAMFTLLILIGALRTFRTLLELTYIFSRYNLIFQMFNFAALLLYVIAHFQILFLRNQNSNQFLIFPQELLQTYVGGKVVDLGTAYNLNDSQTLDDIGRMLLFLSFPFSFLQFILLFFNADWVLSYHCLSMRTLPGMLISTLLCMLVYFATFLPLNLLDIQQRTNHHSTRYLTQIFTRIFISSEIADDHDARIFSIVIKCIQYFFYIIIAAYVIALSKESYRKASILEMPYQTRYEKELSVANELLSQKIRKVLKQVFSLFVKEKQQRDKEQQQKNKQSQILDDDEMDSDMTESIPDKILIVFEIHNQFLEEINRFKAKRDNTSYPQKKVRVKNNITQPKIGSVISQLLQKNKTNPRLQVMLKKYQGGTDQAINMVEDKQEAVDFFQLYSESINEQGVIIRQFFIIDQVIKFLDMLLKLRPELLSLNAEQRIRIMFYINSDQVEEEDVYKLLSFLIVSLDKHHLNYPILVYSYHKEWYIEKGQYLKLKKFYRNIFATLDKKCALEFCLMATSFITFEVRYSKDQQFYEKEIEEISNSMIEEENDRSMLI